MSNIIEQAKAIRASMDTAGEALTDEQAAKSKDMYKRWKPGVKYRVGQRRRHSGTLYKCLQEHEALPDWTPDKTPALWAEVLIPDRSVIPAWKQPNSTNPYHKGDKVTHKGKKWISTTANNVWEPGAYGWKEIE